MFVWVCAARVTVKHHRQKSCDVNIQRFQLSSRCENHGWVPMIWCDSICGGGGETLEMPERWNTIEMSATRLCKSWLTHQQEILKKGHSWLLKTTVKLMDMLLHVCMSVCCKSHCQTPQTKQWWWQHSENSVEFQMWKSWVGAYDLMWFHMWRWWWDIGNARKMDHNWDFCHQVVQILTNTSTKILKKGIEDFWKPL